MNYSTSVPVKHCSVTHPLPPGKVILLYVQEILPVFFFSEPTMKIRQDFLDIVVIEVNSVRKVIIKLILSFIYVYNKYLKVVLITQNTLRTSKGIQVYIENDLNFTAASDLNKCLKQIELPVLFHSFAPISEFPAYRDLRKFGNSPLSLIFLILDGN